MEWLLDNYASLVGQMLETGDALSGRAYQAVLRRAPHRDARPRVYAIARELVDDVIERMAIGDATAQVRMEAVVSRFEQAQADQAFRLVELWAIKPFLKLALFEKLQTALLANDLRSPRCAAVVQGVVESFHAIDDMPWRELTESLSTVDSVLRLDPAGVYGRMDFETRDDYRRAVERIAEGTCLSEEEVARLAVELACGGRPAGEATDHVGWYLVGAGARVLERCAGYAPPLRTRIRTAIERRPTAFHLGAIAVVTLAIVVLAAARLQSTSVLLWLMLIPATQAAVEIVNRVVHGCLRPRRLPRLDFSSGVPDDCRTFVVVPTLLLSKRHVEGLIERLEIHYLANRDPNLRFALLTDGPDADTPTTEHDRLADLCCERIRELNDRYASDGCRPFYLFHRNRTWNPGESVWMGHERKRGKLNDFNWLLLGGPDVFAVTEGDLSDAGETRYVITLDTDTQLPRDAARTLIGTAAHPLNRPVLDPVSGIVRSGYAILQPRIGINMLSAERSRFAKFQSGAAGLDPYATAVSDVYQDLYGQATFTGKGLYDLAAFHAVVDGRFPDNALLSHDLIEGEHARVGLVTDLELIDDYPASYETYAKRDHRWIRGDWQLVPWLMSRVPHGHGGSIENPLPFVSRWKIFDNLRRSLVAPSLLAFLIAGWWADTAFACTVAAVMLLSAGTYIDLVLSLLQLPPRRLLRSYQQMKLAHVGRRHLEVLGLLLFLPHQALVAMDAVVRTLVRRFITGRHLLEWESMAQADGAPTTASRGNVVHQYLFLTPVLATGILATVWAATGQSSVLAVLTAGAWIGSPWVARWMDGPASRRFAVSARDAAFLRDLALRTWRFFVDWSQPETHWLVPDHVNDASGVVAYRTSPTNIGLQLGAVLAAHDFGYVTHRELGRRLTLVLDTIEALELHRGHPYNWYDTRTLEPLPPRYVSAVDNGNLCATLLTIKHGCLESLKRPIADPRLFEGLRDHCIRVQKSLPRRLRTPFTRRQVARLVKTFETAPTDLIAWMRALADARLAAMGLADRVIDSESSGRARQNVDEARYWATALVNRIDAVAADLRLFAPFAEALLPADVRSANSVGAVEPARRRVPTIADAESYYTELEQAARARLQSPGLAQATARRLRRMIDDTAAARLGVRELVNQLQTIAERASRIVAEMDFAFLFDERRKLLRIGYDAEAQMLDGAHYGLLASEARTAVLLAIAKHDVPRDAWFRLGRTLTVCEDHRTLVSWTGSMFEYLMPALFMRSHDGTLLGASVRHAVEIQQLYGRERRVPWGISEAAYGRFAHVKPHRYQPFGVPGLATKRIDPTDLVIAPYATFLALMVDPAAAVRNLRTMVFRGWAGSCGLYESIDYRARATRREARPSVVPLFMAHHQGMSLMAVDNALFDNAMQRRFHAEPLVAAVELLLQERLPGLVPDTEIAVPTATKTSSSPAPLTTPAAAAPPQNEHLLPPEGSVLPAS